MMRIAGTLAVAISSSAILSIIVKATVVCGAALVATHLARQSRAALRHLLLATALLLLPILPLLSIGLPARELRIPMTDTTRIEFGSAEIPIAVVVPATALVEPPVAVSAPRSWRSLSALGLGIWLLGVVAIALPVVSGFIHLRRVRRNGLPWRSGQGMVSALAAARGIGSRIDVLLDETVVGPMTSGVIRPAIVLPMDSRDWDNEELRRAVVHELEHIRRRDWLTLCVARSVCALYWFHPLVWMAWRQLRLEAEKACDDAVLREAAPEVYADQLVMLAERMAATATPSAVAMASRSDLSARISAVLDDRQARGRAGLRSIVTATFTGGLLLIGVAPLRAVVSHRATNPATVPVVSTTVDATPAKLPVVPGGAPRLDPSPVARLVSSERQASAPKPAAEAPLPRFQVVSIKVNNSGSALPGVPRLTPGRATVTNISLSTLIQASYGIQEYQLIGLPAWADAARFDLVATSDSKATPAEMLQMIKGVLADRFQFAIRKDTRPLDVYALVETSPGSSKLKRSQANCAALKDSPVEQRPAAAQAAAPGDRSRCQILPMTGRGRLIATGAAIADIVYVLNSVVGRMVIDKTGLTGPFDVDLSWTPDPALQAVVRAADVPDAPSIFTAVEEQLGLHLSPDKASVEVIVVERLEPPTPD